MSEIRLKVLAALTCLLFLGLVGFVVWTHPGEAELSDRNALAENLSTPRGATDGSPEPFPVDATAKDEQQVTVAACPTDPARKPVSDRPSIASQAAVSQAVPSYPQQAKALAHPTNYGERVTRDLYGRPVNNQYIVVLHETVGSAASTIRFFQTPHDQDNKQISYHTLITADGTVVYLVPPEKRAFGAGNSVFQGPQGLETVKTKLTLPPSVNNFAYHISLETPPDGRNNRSGHSGYTKAQYQSLAWLVAKTGVPDSRITTHRAVDRSGDRYDPRSFELQRFFSILNTYPRASLPTYSSKDGACP